MSRRLVPLGPDAVDDVPGRCRSCVFWELGARRPSDDEAVEDRARDGVRKQAWTTSVALETGPPGVLVRDGRRVVGFASFAPATAYARRGAGIPVASADALLLATAHLEAEARSCGVGRQLVAAALREAIRLDLDGVEAYGDRRARESDCVLPGTWLLHEGFEVVAEHPRYPLLRIDVERTVPWAASLEHALDLLRGRAPAVVPARPGTAGTTVDATTGAGADAP